MLFRSRLKGYVRRGEYSIDCANADLRAKWQLANEKFAAEVEKIADGKDG